MSHAALFRASSGEKETLSLSINLYLTFAIASLSIVLFVYLSNARYGRAASMTIYIGAALATAFGLWVQSNLLRFAGGIWFLISVVAIFYPFVSGGKIVWSPAVFLFIVIGILSLCVAYTLLFSRNFRIEFHAEKANRPPYKQALGKALIVGLIIAAVIATAVDIYNLAKP